MMISLTALVLGFLLDLFLGDPHWLPHPVRLIGSLISYLETRIRSFLPKSSKGELLGGAILTVIISLLAFLIPLLLLFAAGKIGIWLRFLLETLMCYQLIAAKALRTESMKVYEHLVGGDLPSARKAVSMIVGRDTQKLTETGVTKAAVETIAENTSDGVVAPLIFLALGGAPLGFFYKAVNTMDSMIGYKNEKYLYFGRVAARLDDVINYIPSRFSAIFMIVAAYLLRLNGRGAWRIYHRDNKKHASPNSAQTESVCAGAMDIQLAGDAHYFGRLYHKPTIGDAVRPIEVLDIVTANHLMYGTSFLALIFCAVFRLLWIVLF